MVETTLPAQLLCLLQGLWGKEDSTSEPGPELCTETDSVLSSHHGHSDSHPTVMLSTMQLADPGWDPNLSPTDPSLFSIVDHWYQLSHSSRKQVGA